MTQGSAEQRATPTQPTAARYIADLFSVPGMPQFITDALMVEIGAAGRALGIDFWLDDERGFDVPGLAKLFEAAGEEYEPAAPTLADHLAAVMNDPNAPESITHALGKVLCRMADDAHAASKPEFIAALLDAADSSNHIEAGDE